MSKTLAACSLTLVLSAAPGAAQAGAYELTLLGTFGGTYSVTYDINEHEQTVGIASTFFNNNYLPATWKRGNPAPINLEMFSGPQGAAYAINNAGRIVGEAYPRNGRFFHATLWSANQQTDLGTLGGTSSRATGINQAGDVTGWSYITGDSQTHATLWSRGQIIDLGSLGGTVGSTAEDINDRGQVVGQSSSLVGIGEFHAALFAKGTVTDLGVLGLPDQTNSSNAWAINNAGQIVGESWPEHGSGNPHAVLWEGTRITDLGTLGGTFSIAFDINNHGVIIGNSTIAGDKFQHATLWDHGVARDLNSFLDGATVAAGWYLASASAIDDRGSITGEA